MTWNENNIATLKKLWADRFSASQIAAVIGGITRNAVIGKVHRLNLSGHPRPLPRPRVHTRPRSRLPAPPASREGPRKSRRTDLPELGPAPAYLVRVRELTATHCRWPEGDPKKPEFHFCGREALPAQPYCAHHKARATQK